MKKFLPIILLVVGLLVFGGVYFFVIRKPAVETIVDDEDTSSLIEIAFEDRPLVTLTPRSDGHWLDLTLSNLGKFKAESLEYELVYQVPDKGQQGTGGKLALTGSDIEKEILIGSESSGNYYYDSGVETGMFTLKFRNDKGKLIAKFSTEFHIQTDTDTLTNVDGDFVVTLDESSDEYFVVMDTIGFPELLDGEVSKGPYGVFTSSSDPIAGKTNLSGNVTVFNESSEVSSALGVFVVTQ